MKIKVSDIIIKTRAREDIGDLDSLMESMAKFGQLHPIILNTKLQLIAGNRRLESAKRLGWQMIDANIIDVKSKADLLEIEIDENMQRKDFSEDDIAEAYKKLARLRKKNIFVRFFDWIAGIFKKLFGRYNTTDT
ncbi:MAG: ParB N-terminal domain-containing protein [Spirochaetes bacterium]|nr:ParB N-terminal domain-containing protein [Spirochaetota bacterium]